MLDRVKKHVKENVDPWTEEYHALGREQAKIDRWDHHPKQVELMEAAKQKARENGLWNFFLPGSRAWRFIQLDYTYMRTSLERTDFFQTMNCSAPDTGNMEVLERVEQKSKKNSG